MFKMPVLGAENEYRAIGLLESLGIPTMKARAFGTRGRNPARRESFLVTEELRNVISLENFCKNWKTSPPQPELRNAILRKLAETVAGMHFAGLCHRDCYLCHFLLDTDALEAASVRLIVLDLHRAVIRPVIRRRARVKDLAGIVFSSMDLGLAKEDFLRFAAIYSSFGELDSRLWRDVLRTAEKLYRKEFGKPSPYTADISGK